jgi:hypothetical protein
MANRRMILWAPSAHIGELEDFCGGLDVCDSTYRFKSYPMFTHLSQSKASAYSM